jgi:hypothetical protein
MYRLSHVRGAIANARAAAQPVASSSRIRIPAKASPLRALHTTPKPQARYERFDPQPQWRSGPSGAQPGGGGPKFTEYLKRRLGGDRAVWLYGIGLGGGGLYYVTQYVCIFPAPLTCLMIVLSGHQRPEDYDSWMSTRRRSVRYVQSTFARTTRC